MITGYLYLNDRMLLCGLYEDLEDFIEQLKSLNKEHIDRRKFKILGSDKTVLKRWFRK